MSVHLADPVADILPALAVVPEFDLAVPRLAAEEGQELAAVVDMAAFASIDTGSLEV